LALALACALATISLSARAETMTTAAERPPGRGLKLAGILTTSIAGGLGVATLATGSVMNTCAGAFGDSKTRCRRNAEQVMRTGAVITAVAAAVGVPLIVAGVSKNREWQREQDAPATTLDLEPTSASPELVAYELPLLRIVF
jgi:hypothetical protein